MGGYVGVAVLRAADPSRPSFGELASRLLDSAGKAKELNLCKDSDCRDDSA
jgi:hypothetical protein